MAVKNETKEYFLKGWKKENLDSRETAQGIFLDMIYPVSEKHFFKTIWEKKPLYLKRTNKKYNDKVFSTDELYRILRNNDIQFSVNIDVTSYVNEQRYTHNTPGRADALSVLKFYNQGCSIRMLNPQTYSNGLWLLNSKLQEYFQSVVGSNIYLTPPGTQGFAPHYDDIEAFVLQLEGKKRWWLYKPREGEELPKESSPNFSQAEIGEVILDVIVEPGDLLYFPRGTIHQAECLPDAHSLHVTVSTYQKNTWSDFLEMALQQGLETSICEDVNFRRGLPLRYMTYMGAMYSDTEDKRRDNFKKKVKSLLLNLVDNIDFDETADQMGLNLTRDSLPPFLSKVERNRTVDGCHQTNGNTCNESDSVAMREPITPLTAIKLVSFGVLRVVSGTDGVVAAYNTENSRVYHGKEENILSISFEEAVAVEHIIKSYPNFIKVKSLPLGTKTAKVKLSENLFCRGLLQIK